MRTDLPTGYFPALYGVPNVPGGTPAHVPATAPPSSPTGVSDRPALLRAGGHLSTPSPRSSHWAAELLEDGFLLLVIVFTVPAVILLLAVPFAVVLALAAMVAGRW